MLRADSSIWIAFAWNWSEKRGHLNVNDIEAECAWGRESAEDVCVRSQKPEVMLL